MQQKKRLLALQFPEEAGVSADYFFNTILIIFFGTTITFATVNPSIHLADCGSFSAAASASSEVTSAGNSIGKRALPLKATIILTESSLRNSSLKTGQGASHTVVS